jgi:hypothetical protein
MILLSRNEIPTMSSSNKPIALTRDCDSIAIPSGTRKTLSSGETVRIMQSRGGSYTVSTDTGSMYRVDVKDADALGLSAPLHCTISSNRTAN